MECAVTPHVFLDAVPPPRGPLRPEIKRETSSTKQTTLSVNK